MEMEKGLYKPINQNIKYKNTSYMIVRSLKRKHTLYHRREGIQNRMVKDVDGRRAAPGPVVVEIACGVEWTGRAAILGVVEHTLGGDNHR